MAVGLSVPCDRFAAFAEHVQQKITQVPLLEEEGEPAVRVTEEDRKIDQIIELEGLRPYPRELITRIALPAPVLQSVQCYDRVNRYHFESICGGFDGVQFTSARTEPMETIECLIGTPSVNRFRDRINAQIVVEAFRETGDGTT